MNLRIPHRQDGNLRISRAVFSLAAAPWLLASLSAPLSEGGGRPVVILQDRQPYYRSSYQAFASPWSTYLDKSFVRGRDYADTIRIAPARFPDGTRFDTCWPTRPPTKSGVWGYNALSFGNYDGGRPPKPVPPTRVLDIKRLNERFAFRYAGSPFFNLLTEFYLTSIAGDENAKVMEIGFFLHTPQTTTVYARAGTFLARYRDRQGRTWEIRRQGSYLLIIPVGGEDVLSGVLEIAPLLSLLMEKRVLTGREWFNGIAFGMEPAPGGGNTRLVVDHWRVEYR